MGDHGCDQVWDLPTAQSCPVTSSLSLTDTISTQAWQGSFLSEVFQGTHIPFFPSFLFTYSLKIAPPLMRKFLFSTNLHTFCRSLAIASYIVGQLLTSVLTQMGH